MTTLILRFAHVFFAALWVGMMAYQVFILMPALTEAGPDAGKVMGSMMRRRIPLVMLVIALIAIISGTWLFMRMMGGDPRAFMQTPMGKAFGWGGTAAIVGFLLGIFVVRPAMMSSVKLSESLAAAPPEERVRRQAEIQRLRARGAVMGRVVTVLLLIALGLMAVARYL